MEELMKQWSGIMSREAEVIVASMVPVEVDWWCMGCLMKSAGQVILVEGSPGVGKASLIYHYAK